MSEVLRAANETLARMLKELREKNRTFTQVRSERNLLSRFPEAAEIDEAVGFLRESVTLPREQLELMQPLQDSSPCQISQSGHALAPRRPLPKSTGSGMGKPYFLMVRMRDQSALGASEENVFDV